MINYDDARGACEAYLSALVAKDVDAIVDLYADDATVEDPVGTEVLSGSAAIRAFYAEAVGGVQDACMTGQPRLAGSEVAFPFQVTAGQPGQAVVINIIDVFRFNASGKITSMRAFWGAENFGQQDKG